MSLWLWVTGLASDSYNDWKARHIASSFLNLKLSIIFVNPSSPPTITAGKKPSTSESTSQGW